ncbi:MAG: hypothetical protein HQK51_03220 [Oligoflexia bacterium]|nr:hypothetical protein [Oligoflexia bacterium]
MLLKILRLKIYLIFWTNLYKNSCKEFYKEYYKKYFYLCLIIFSLIIFYSSTKAQQTQTINSQDVKDINGNNLETSAGLVDEITLPGMVYSLNKIISSENALLKKITLAAFRNIKTLDQLKINNNKIRDITIHPTVISQMLLRSDQRFLFLAGENSYDECIFFSLLENNLLKMSFDEKNKNMIINIVYKDNKKELALIKKEDFFTWIYNNHPKCAKNKEYSVAFNLENLAKTIEKIDFKIPKREDECHEIFNDWIKNPLTPYICKISEIFSNAKKLEESVGGNILDITALRDDDEKILFRFNQKLKGKFNDLQYVYVNNLCKNLLNNKDFCLPYLSKSFWIKVLNGEKPAGHIKYRCQELLKKEEIIKNDYPACVQKLENNNNSCHYLNATRFPSLTPKPNCQSISLALNNSRINNYYQDCPMPLDNDVVINISRIYHHLNNTVFESNPLNCSGMPMATFYKIVNDSKNEKYWNFFMCYFNQNQGKELCIPFYPGTLDNSKLFADENIENAEPAVVANILSQSTAAPDNLKCTILNKKYYRPTLLKYKNGCFLLYDETNCTTGKCPKEIIYNDRKITHIQYKIGFLVRYISTDTQELRYSAMLFLNDLLHFTENRVNNLPELKFHLNAGSQTLIHGVGCREDFFPSFFKQTTMNQCRGIPFLVDGIIEKNSKSYVVIRTALDDIGSPRIMSWNHFYSAIKSYQNSHPLKTWALYAIKK